jgi:two-component system alkaline phosphatase synthesis response regulator PhoP
MTTETVKPQVVAIANHDAVLLGLLQQTFQEAGYDTMLLPTGSAGYQVVKEKKPDLVMLDTWLADEAGAWLLVQILRMDAETRHIPVLLTTSGSDFGQRADALPKESGIDILNKPYNPEEVIEKARQALERKS